MNDLANCRAADARLMARICLGLAALTALALCLLVTPARAQQAENPWALPSTQTADYGRVLQPVRGRRRGHATRIEYAAPMDIRSSSQILAEAQRYVGMGKVTRYAGAWCRDFINMVAARTGRSLGNHSRLARDIVGAGTRVSNPQPGDVALLRFGRRYHVTFYAGHAGPKIVGLGGNQGRNVRFSHYSARQVVAYVRL